MPAKEPVIILNYKTYTESMGEQGRKLTWMAMEVMKETGVRIVACPQLPEMYHHKNLDIEIFAQHVDPIEPGGHTGHILPEALKCAGATGTLINHSEDRMPADQIRKCVELCRKHGLTSVVCAESVEKVKEVAAFKPDYIAIEPPELIGSGIPVSKANPDIVRNSVNAVTDPEIKVLCGAGISTGDDVKAALALGTHGVLLASGVVKAKDPKKALYDLVSLIAPKTVTG
ncbi:triosephosphate isomerase [Methanocella arvoryzae MRE50]|uniref:Triosephosphate isomerase n=2 Tax=Methanocella TaxID=570266 RepID=Q0W648_METAR|nr:triose-phosphate isomerase [Methanocella arvoryzae]CAJ36145.1 triosephosphate isomerase [Methanocella arvoryzae MRE50]